MTTWHRSLAAAAAGCGLFFTSGYSAAAVIRPGDLLISEVMANPAAVSDTNGEWFELFNRTLQPLDLTGMVLADAGADYHVIAAGAPLTIAPGGYFVLARNGDPALNGGLIADYVYSGFTLGNAGDEIVLSLGAAEIVRLAYGAAFAPAGISMELIAPPAGYAATPAHLTYGLGDVGTPGAPGSVPLAAVPLPAAAWLFLCGVFALLHLSRGRPAARGRQVLPARA